MLKKIELLIATRGNEIIAMVDKLVAVLFTIFVREHHATPPPKGRIGQH
jgi:hypothetical protein